MTAYEKDLLLTLEKVFAKGENHYTFDIPDNPEDYKKLLSALQTLENKSYIYILHSPELTDDDFIEVEMCPPCVKLSNNT